MIFRRLCRFQLALLCLFLSASVSAADDAKVKNLVSLLTELNQRTVGGQFDQAEPIAKRLIDLTETSFRDDAAVRVIASTAVAMLYDLQNRYRDAEPHMQRALSLSNALKGNNALPAVQSLQMLALMYTGQERMALPYGWLEFTAAVTAAA